MFGRRVDHLADFGDLGCRKAADLGVLLDDVLARGEVDAERLVGRDKAVDPLDIWAKLAQHLVLFRRRAAQLLALEAAGAGDVALDDEFAQGHFSLLLMRRAIPMISRPRAVGEGILARPEAQF